MGFDTIKPKDIHKGDILWESGQYGSVQFEVVEEPTHVGDKWEWQGRTAKRGIVTFGVTDGYEHYGPKIYKQPVYQFPPPEYLNEES